MIVPADAVQRTPKGDVVFVATNKNVGAGAFKAVPVVVSARKNGEAELTTALDTDTVVVAGAFVLKSELLRASLGEGHAH